jgi:RNA polymerase sigma-70 factor (ECF subfamily)
MWLQLDTIRPFFCMADNTPSAEQAISDTFARYSKAIIRYCERHTGSREEAEDVTQEAFLKTWLYLQAGRTVANMKTFLYSVATNVIVDRYRKNHGQNHLSLDVLQEQGFDLGYEDLGSLQDSLYVQQLLNTFKTKHSSKSYKLLVLRYVKGLSPAQIAGHTGMTANAVAVHLHRAVKRLAEKMPGAKAKTQIDTK